MRRKKVKGEEEEGENTVLKIDSDWLIKPRTGGIVSPIQLFNHSCNWSECEHKQNFWRLFALQNITNITWI